MSGRPWYAFYPADYERDTAHLSLLEHGAYRRLMDHYYSTANLIPTNLQQVYRLTRAFEATEQAAVQSVLAQFFKPTPDGYRHGRIEQELEKSRVLSERGVKAGRASATRRQQDANKTPTKVQPSQSQSQKKEVPSLRSGSARAKVQKATRWPDHEVIPEDWVQAAGMKRGERGLETIDLRYEAERFVNYWTTRTGQKAVHVNWDRVWMNWATDREKTGKAHKNGHTQGTGNGRLSPHEKFARAGLSIILDAERSAAGDGDNNDAGQTQRPLLAT